MANSRQIEHTAAEWLARRDAAGWSAADQAQLSTWLELALAHRVAFIRLESAWAQSDRLKALGAGVPRGVVPVRGSLTTSAFADRHSPDARESIPSQTVRTTVRGIRRPRYRLRYVAAAVVLLAMSLTLSWRYYIATDEATYQTALGALQVVHLADGSVVTLNSNSRVHATLSRRKRSIDLQQGEAFFEVARDPGRPFVVTAGRRHVTALGTAFAVRRDTSDLRVVVTHGMVRLDADNAPGTVRQATTLLPAGSVAVADASGVVVHSGSVQQARDFLSWRDGYLSFRNTPLATAAAEFNRYNAHKIIIADNSVGALRIGGNFRWSNTDAFVRLLEQGFPIRVVRRDDAMVLYHR
ncbi:histidine kinase [Rhodanobacter sp. B05]|uniref:FecR family protein n=1 Tax=Rhodanobacter sp. B05 TaxID=1945859 RepID=UPI000987B822|nr:FecR domain-containing protein [Rhodanobacter sp. B05]OOG52824.1 histidine kinase [Rhodanobacter sp. B05]